MAHQTGTASSPENLRSIIETFALSNGYTGSAGGILTSSTASDSNFQLTTELMQTGVTSSGTTVTIALTGSPSWFGYTVGMAIVVSGATNGNFNGTFTLATVTAGNCTYIASSAFSGAATGTVVIAGSTSILTLNASTSSAGANKVRSHLMVYPTLWPVNYYLFANTSPTTLHCTINYNVSQVQHMAIGSFVPVSSSAFVGTSFARASFDYINASTMDMSLPSLGLSMSSGSSYLSSIASYVYGTCAIGSVNITYGGEGKFVHAEIDMTGWLTGGIVKLTDQSAASLYYSPNTWNNQAILVPIHLQCITPISTPNAHYIGYIEHLRYIRIDNYNIGDIITLGSDQWMVFPVAKKDTVNRDGIANSTSGLNSTGTIGYAIRYT